MSRGVISIRLWLRSDVKKSPSDWEGLRWAGQGGENRPGGNGMKIAACGAPRYWPGGRIEHQKGMDVLYPQLSGSILRRIRRSDSLVAEGRLVDHPPSATPGPSSIWCSNACFGPNACPGHVVGAVNNAETFRRRQRVASIASAAVQHRRESITVHRGEREQDGEQQGLHEHDLPEPRAAGRSRGTPQATDPRALAGVLGRNQASG